MWRWLHRLKGKQKKLYLTICTRLHSSILLLVERFLVQLKISGQLPRIIFKAIFKRITRHQEWYDQFISLFNYSLKELIYWSCWLCCIFLPLLSSIKILVQGSTGKWLSIICCHSLFQVIAASGAVKHEDFVEQVKKLFTKLSAEPTTATQLVAKEPASFTGSEVQEEYYLESTFLSIDNLQYQNYIFTDKQVRIIDDDVPLAQFAIAYNGASWTDPDSIALMVMQAMLGSWNKSAGGGKHMRWFFPSSFSPLLSLCLNFNLKLITTTYLWKLFS